MKCLLFSVLLFTLGATSNLKNCEIFGMESHSIITEDDILMLNSGSSSSTITGITYSRDFSTPEFILGCNQQNCTVDISGWPAGIYEVEATTSTGGTFSDFIFVN